MSTGHSRSAYFVFLLGFAVLLAIGGEAVVRLRGGEPWHPLPIHSRVEPGGKFFAPHPTLGYSHLPGHFEVTLNRNYTFGVTHGPDTLRVTHPDPESFPTDAPQIWIFGCSITHGWSLPDEDTYPWLLQERLPGFRVVNFGVDGYGTAHGLIQFREALEQRGAPLVAIVSYASFHDIRNTFLRKPRKTVALLNRLGPLLQPYARLDENGELKLAMADVVYREAPGMRRSALIHLAEQTYNRYEDFRYGSQNVSRAIVLEFQRIADQAGVVFVLAGIARDTENRLIQYDGTTADMLAFAASRGIQTVDISVDLNNVENVNLPHDFHPSALANRRYADSLDRFLHEQHLLEAANRN